MKINFAYFGSSYFSAILLEKIINDTELKDHLDLKFIATQKDKPAGRKQILMPTPVKSIAKKYGIPVYCFELEERSSKSGSKYGILTADAISRELILDLDLVLVYAYGAIISNKILERPKYGFWNVHPSLLPLYRGTAPMAAPLIKGDKTTGVSIIKMDDKMDHGPIIDQKSYTIENSDKRPDLEVKLTDIGFALFKKNILDGIGKISLKNQDDEKATYTEKLRKDDGFIEIEKLKTELKNSPLALSNLFRGLYPWPGIWTLLPNKKRLKITDMEFADGKLTIKKVQLEGKREVDFETFNKNYRVF